MISLRLATDFSGTDKTMEFMCDLVSKVIEDLGPTNIFSVVMDGSCKGDFPLIRPKYHHIQYFTCPTHGIDGYIKNICTSKEEIGIQKNDMTGVGVEHVKWTEDFFSKVFSSVFAMDRQFCRRDMDTGVKKDVGSKQVTV